MTTRNNNLSAGTNGTPLNTTNAGGTGNTQFTTVTVPVGSTLVFDNLHAAKGGSLYGLKFTPGSGLTDNTRWSGFSSTAYAQSLYLWFDTLPTADFWLDTLTGGGTTALRLMFSASTGKLALADTRGTGAKIWTAANAMPTGTLVRIELFATQSATAGTVNMNYFLDDSTTAIENFSTATAQTGSVPFDTHIIGKTDSSAYTTPFWIGGIRTDDAASGNLGPWPSAAAATVRPSGVSASSGTWTNVGGAASLAAALADESDATYDQSPDAPTGQFIEYTLPLLDVGDVQLTARLSEALSTTPITATVELREGATVRATRTYNPATSAGDFVMTLTTGENAAISDRGNLRVRISGTV